MLVKSKSCTKDNCVCEFATSYPTASLTIFLLGSIVFVSMIFINANAQSPPILPPPSSLTTNDDVTNLRVSPNDHSPPEIDVVNIELKQGKNLFVVKINDSSDLKSLHVKYVDKGDIKVTDLVKDHDNQYMALVNVQPPTCIIVIDAMDAANNTASFVKEFKVTQESTNVLDQFFSWVKGLFSNF